MTPPILRWTGALRDLAPSDRAKLERRLLRPSSDKVRWATARIITDVYQRGDAALRDLARDLDDVRLESLEVPREKWRDALSSIPLDLRRALERAARNVATVQGATKPRTVDIAPEPGIVVIRRADPIRSVGVYAPGGRAAYPSSVIMTVVPARVAGVPEIIVCAPPTADGLPAQVTLAAAELAGASRVFAVGGAGAIAAMAFGTESIPRVDRIVGPGNAYVAEAKRRLADIVAIDCPAGPSEILIIADATASPAQIAAELIAQAEHDAEAIAIALVPDEALARAVLGGVAAEIDASPRRSIIERSLRKAGGILTASLDDSIAFANAFAPEHLLLAISDSGDVATWITAAGTICIGAGMSVAFGDYLTGANHVLPTGGAARSWSGLSTSDFMRFTTVQWVSPDARRSLAADVAVIADAEGLNGHARAAWLSAVVPDIEAQPVEAA
jgi:histidinol dehydrogenase